MQDIQSGSTIDPSDVTIGYIGGGSREWAPTLVRDLAVSEYGGQVRLYDVDPESAQLNADFGNWVQDRDDATGEWAYETADSLEAVLSGVDLVILSTQYNPIETFVPDLRISKSYGIHHAVGATIGPGGIFRAMRTIPTYRGFARAIREHCPGAWVINYTNPVHAVTRALYDEYPGINALGLCHEVRITRREIAELAREEWGIDADREDIWVNVKGINHFTWVDEIQCDGTDLWSLFEELQNSERATKTFEHDDLADESPFVDNWQVTWELFRRFGLLPAAGDRHLVEYAQSFMQGGESELNRWGLKRTTADFRSEHWTPAESDQTQDVEGWLSGEEAFELTSSEEEFVSILGALAGDGPLVTNVNLPNQGQVTDLEHGAVVETNAVIDEGHVTPTAAGGFPRPLRKLIRGHIDTIETIVEASRTGDLDLAFQGFVTDDQVRTLTPEEQTDLFAELVAAERSYLDDWNLADARILEEATTYPES